MVTASIKSAEVPALELGGNFSPYQVHGVYINETNQCHSLIYYICSASWLLFMTKHAKMQSQNETSGILCNTYVPGTGASRKPKSRISQISRSEGIPFSELKWEALFTLDLVFFYILDCARLRIRGGHALHFFMSYSSEWSSCLERDKNEVMPESEMQCATSSKS